MKKYINGKKFLSISIILLLVFFVGCQKVPNSEVDGVKDSELKEGRVAAKLTIKSNDTIPRISKLSSNSVSNLTQKKKNIKATVSTNSFTATLYGGSQTNYYCEAEIEFPGPLDWYLYEESKPWTFTYIATTAGNSIFFFLDYPTPGFYHVVGQGTDGTRTNSLYLN